MADQIFASGIRHDSWKDKKRFMQNILSRCDSLAILAKAIAERPEDVFSDRMVEVCKEIKEKHGMRMSPNIKLYL